MIHASIDKISLKITYLRLHSNSSGVRELTKLWRGLYYKYNIKNPWPANQMLFVQACDKPWPAEVMSDVMSYKARSFPLQDVVSGGPWPAGHQMVVTILSLIAGFMGLTWGHLGPTGPRWAPCWPMGPMLAPWTLLSGVGNPPVVIYNWGYWPLTSALLIIFRCNSVTIFINFIRMQRWPGNLYSIYIFLVAEVELNTLLSVAGELP